MNWTLKWRRQRFKDKMHCLDATAGAVERRMSMYCNGNCEFLDKKRKKCKADGTIVAYMRVRGRNLAYACYEHRVGCVKDREGEADGET